MWVCGSRANLPALLPAFIVDVNGRKWIKAGKGKPRKPFG
jgi:hypothetical protein